MIQEVRCGDSAEILKEYEDNHFDSVVTDPPYGIKFLGRDWDKNNGSLDVWKQAYRVLKPGGHLLAFSAPRTYHRLATIIENTGFEIRDQVMWIYAQGSPKAQDTGKAFDKRTAPRKQCLEQLELVETAEFVSAYPYRGWRASLKPAHEPIVMARKPFKTTVLNNVLSYGTGALNIDGCVIPGEQLRYPANGAKRLTFGQQEPEKWDGTVTEGHENGRYPHNVIGEVEGYQTYFYCPKASTAERYLGCQELPRRPFTTNRPYGGGPEARKASNEKGSNNPHPTLKPVKLMAYLVRLVTPKGGYVLDPFCGSGSTGMGCAEEGMNFVGIELDKAYCEIARLRIAAWASQKKVGGTGKSGSRVAPSHRAQHDEHGISPK